MKTDRDQSIEHLLRRSLPAPDPAGDCPDAEALAALADASLSPVERQMMETHIADCDRCQMLMAGLVRTASAGSEWFGVEEATSPWWKRRGTLNWLVPATAAATAVALWVAVPGQQPPLLERAQSEVQTAAPPAPQAGASPVSEPTAPSQAATAPPDPGALAFKLPASDRVDGRTRDGVTDTALGATASADTQPTAAAAESLMAREEVRQERAAAAPPALAPAEADAAAGNRATPVAAARAAAPAAASFDVVSPDPRIRWRVGAGTTVQYSADGGASWTAQQTGVSTPLTAGSAPSPTVSWLVGPGGTVLRTVDGGRQWQRVAFPEAGVLVAVRASNAQTATVELGDGRRLGTTDGGQTWFPATD